VIAVCGLVCGECRIHNATNSPELAQEIADWLSDETDTEVDVGSIRCEGCRGPRERHWSPDCWILKCCVDDRGLESCGACRDFPCQALEEWAATSARYGDALERLRNHGDQ
jgi:hypothetical protein